MGGRFLSGRVRRLNARESSNECKNSVPSNASVCHSGCGILECMVGSDWGRVKMTCCGFEWQLCGCTALSGCQVVCQAVLFKYTVARGVSNASSWVCATEARAT